MEAIGLEKKRVPNKRVPLTPGIMRLAAVLAKIAKNQAKSNPPGAVKL
jgi:hypothetical protein